MKLTLGRTVVAASITFGVIVFLLLRGKLPATNAAVTVSETVAAPVAPPQAVATAQLSGGPLIVLDTENDSPGTNSVTRIVTLKARIGGEPPLELQWKMDKGSGFVEISGATNETYRIGNARIEDTGVYALFGRNAGGEIHTTPTRITVIEVED